MFGGKFSIISSLFLGLMYVQFAVDSFNIFYKLHVLINSLQFQYLIHTRQCYHLIVPRNKRTMKEGMNREKVSLCNYGNGTDDDLCFCAGG